MPATEHRRPLLRTWLFGPGADRGAHAAMSTSGADVLIQDLEDFTPPPRRDEARAVAAELFTRWRAAGACVCVRINSLRDEGPLDLARVVPAKPDLVAYPKAATASDMYELDRAVASAEERAGLAPRTIGIVPVCDGARRSEHTRDRRSITAHPLCAARRGRPGRGPDGGAQS